MRIPILSRELLASCESRRCECRLMLHVEVQDAWWIQYIGRIVGAPLGMAAVPGSNSHFLPSANGIVHAYGPRLTSICRSAFLLCLVHSWLISRFQTQNKEKRRGILHFSFQALRMMTASSLRFCEICCVFVRRSRKLLIVFT